MKIIIFHSYKGGTGKTTLALNTAVLLAKRGHKTLIIDADLNAPTFDSIFQNFPIKYRFNDFFEMDCPPQVQDLPVNSRVHNKLDLIFAEEKPKFGIGLLSMDKNFHANALKKLHTMQSDLSELGYEYVIIDTAPSLNLSSINALIIADASIIVLRPNKYGISGTNFLLKELYTVLGTSKRKDFIVFNQVVPGTPKQIIEDWQNELKNDLNIETIGLIMCNCGIALNMLYGKLLDEDKSYKQYHREMEKIVNKIEKALK